MSGNHLEIEGVVIDCQKGKFRVQTEDGTIIKAQLSGRLRQNKIHILLGDRVGIKVSEYDLTNGIVVYRK